MNYRPIIGIVAKHNPQNTGCEKIYITDATKQAIFDNGAIAIGILPTEYAINYRKMNTKWKDNLTKTEKQNLISQIKLCDGIILQGGLEMDNYEFIVAKYCYEIIYQY